MSDEKEKVNDVPRRLTTPASEGFVGGPDLHQSGTHVPDMAEGGFVGDQAKAQIPIILIDLQDPALNAAKEAGMTWKFGDAEYAMFVTNRTGTVSSIIVNPATSKPVAILTADFMFENAQPFLDHLNLNIRDEKSSREDEAIRKKANNVSQNANLFRDLVQCGSIVKINFVGEKSDPEPKTREDMLKYQPEVQSQMIDDWLGNFHVERYFPPGQDDVDQLLTSVDKVYFTAKIGNYHKPAHVLLFEFNAPSPDARRNYENESQHAGTRTEGDRQITVYRTNWKAKLEFARRYFSSVDGSLLSETFEVQVDTDNLYKFNGGDPAIIQAFRANFNPHWWIVLSNHLADAFDFRGK